MKKIVMYEKATCGTCKKEKSYLTKAKISFEEIDIIKTPPPRDFLEKNIDENNLDAFINKHSKSYKELNLPTKKLSKAELINAMMREPNLIKRPVLINGEKVYFGFHEF